MANTINYAQKWSKTLIPFIMQDTLTGEHIDTDVEWGRGNTFHFTIRNTSGYKDHNRNGGWNRGDIVDTDIAYNLDHDRDIELFYDLGDMLESAVEMKANDLTNNFMIENANPEQDAYFFSSVASDGGTNVTQDEVIGVDITETNVVKFIKGKIKPLRRYGVTNIRGYLSSDMMDLLELAEDFKREIKVQVVSANGNTGEGNAIETRITYLDGVKLIEVFDTDRFYDTFDFTDGYAPVVTVSRPLNCLFCTVSHSKIVPRLSSIYLKSPDEHDAGDGWAYRNRKLMGTVTFPNAKTGNVDSVTGSSGVVVPA